MLNYKYNKHYNMGGCSCCSQSVGKRTELTLVGEYRFKKLSHIAKGAFGSVWVCSFASWSKKYALKEILLKKQGAQDTYKKEVKLLNKVKELGLKGCVKIVSSSLEYQPEDGRVGRIILQLGQGTLLDEVNKRDFSEQEVFEIIGDILTALEGLHKLGIIHLDLKPQNLILIGEAYVLCDFGSAIEKPVDVNTLSKNNREDFEQFLKKNTTWMYSAPEILDPQGKVIGPAADIWMLGCIAFILAFGKTPFTEKSSIRAGRVNYTSTGRSSQLIKKMLVIDPAKRSSTTNLVAAVKQYLNKGDAF